ncbi:MAG: peptide deformylase [Myxococcota bacterium]
MKKEIRIWPDSVLRQVAKPIKQVDDEVCALAQDLLDTMADEAGLAAPQIGVSRRIFVAQRWVETASGFDKSPQGALVCMNPVFVHKEGRMRGEEACLSIPGESGFVNRAQRVVMEYTDLQGQQQQLQADGFLAVCLQHEADHLDGKLWVDYQDRTKRERVRYNMLRLKQTLYRNEQQVHG